MIDAHDVARRAAMDQALEEALSRTLQGAAVFDELDPLDAMGQYAAAILAVPGVDIEDLAMAVAGLAIRLHRAGRGGA